jgi:hypothetical protein
MYNVELSKFNDLISTNIINLCLISKQFLFLMFNIEIVYVFIVNFYFLIIIETFLIPCSFCKVSSADLTSLLFDFNAT